MQRDRAERDPSRSARSYVGHRPHMGRGASSVRRIGRLRAPLEGTPQKIALLLSSPSAMT
eukprot:2050142-Prymnesium_polylepis.1